MHTLPQDRVVSLHPAALFMFRFYAQQQDLMDANSTVVMLNLTDSNAIHLANVSEAANPSLLVMNSLTEKWEAVSRPTPRRARDRRSAKAASPIGRVCLAC